MTPPSFLAAPSSAAGEGGSSARKEEGIDAVQAISAVDLAIWDCLGKLRGEPVYALLGGKTKRRLPVYATTARPDIAHEWGFHGAKIPCRYGPADGDEGLKKNIAVELSITSGLRAMAIVPRTFFRPLWASLRMARSVGFSCRLAS